MSNQPFSRDNDRDRRRREVDLSRLFDTLPPHALEAESAMLGSMILDWRVIGEVLQVVREDTMLYKPENAAIFGTLKDLYNDGHSLDLVQIRQRLDDAGVLEQVGGVDYLIALAESVPAATSAAYYARIVRDKATLRALIDASGKIIQDAFTATGDAQAVVDKAGEAMFHIAKDGAENEATHVNQLLQDVYDELEQREGEGLTGVACGFHDLDNKLNGLQKGDLIILAARPSMGKTALALNMAEHVAADDHLPALVFSLEMSKHALAKRLLCARARVDSHAVRRNDLSPEDMDALAMRVGELSEAPLLIDDTPGLTLMDLRARARRVAERLRRDGKEMACMVVDYLQLLRAPGSDSSRQQEVSEISRGIKALARELEVPIICLSQLNRAAEGREGHKPRLSDLRESGSIEQDADVVLLLHREAYYHKGEDDYHDTGETDLIIAKQRNGPTGVVKLMFNDASARFENVAFGTFRAEEDD